MTNAATGLPFDDIRNLLKDLPGPDLEAVRKARAREGQLTKPPGALGRLESLTEWLCAWQAHHPPRAERIVVAVFAGNHGVVDQGVAAYPQEVTQQMVANFQNDGAAVNQICKSFGLGLKVFELALEKPTRDITAGRRRWRRPNAPPPWPMAWKQLRVATCSASARWGSATPRSRRRSRMGCSAARRRTGWGPARASTRRA